MESTNLANTFLSLHTSLFFLLVLGLAYGTYLLFIAPKLNWQRIKIVAIATAFLYLGSFLFGQLLYPLYFPELRPVVDENGISQAIALFEIKDHLSTLGVFMALGILAFGMFGHMHKASMVRRQVFGSMFATITLLVITTIIVAFILNGYS